MAIGSKLYARTAPFIWEKKLAGTLLKKTYYDNTSTGYACNDPYWTGSVIVNTGGTPGDNTAFWYCNGSAWVAK